MSIWTYGVSAVTHLVRFAATRRSAAAGFPLMGGLGKGFPRSRVRRLDNPTARRRNRTHKVGDGGYPVWTFSSVFVAVCNCAGVDCGHGSLWRGSSRRPLRL